MMLENKNVFVIDDENFKLCEKQLTDIFPASCVTSVRSVEAAIKKMGEGILPELLFLDATVCGWDASWGAGNAHRVLTWLHDNARDHRLPHIIFISNDRHLAEQSKDILLQVLSDSRLALSFDIIATNKEELRLAKEIIGILRSTEKRPTFGSDCTALREFLNSRYGFALPLTQEALDLLIMEKGEPDGEDIVRMVNAGRIPLVEGLTSLAFHVPPEVRSLFSQEVNFYGDDFETIMGVSLRFQRGSGRPITGPAVFSVDDVAATAGKGGAKQILITRDVGPGVLTFLGRVAGIVAFSPKSSGHLEMLAQAHGISALLGGTDSSGNGRCSRVRFRKQAKSHLPYLSIPVDLEMVTEGNLVRLGVAQDTGQPDVRPLHGRKDQKKRIGRREARLLRGGRMIVRAGDEVTVNAPHSMLHPMRLPIRETSPRWHSWLNQAESLLRKWHVQSGLPLLNFKHNIDVLEQLHDRDELLSIGLLRTEHLLVSSPSDLEAFRSIVLRKDREALSAFQTRQKEEFIRLFESMHWAKDSSIRIRLIDAPPPEFFDERDLSEIKKAYGDENIRGVQLAEKIPELYQAQIRAAFGAYKDVQARVDRDDLLDRLQCPLEIMVPTVRTARELVVVKEWVDRIAEEFGVDEKDYRFGSMLETLEACKNVDAIAQNADFLSIGSNDLTSEVLDCGRNDWGRRRQLTVDSGEGHDPFMTIHPNVVAVLMDAVSKARFVKPNLQVDLCGEHAVDLRSLNALRPLRLDGVSSPPSAYNQRGLAILYMLDTFLGHTTAAREDLSNRHEQNMLLRLAR